MWVAPLGTDPTEPGWSWLGTLTNQAPAPALTSQRISDMFDSSLHHLITREETNP